MEAMPLRTQLRERAQGSAARDGGLWDWLRARLELPQYRPQALPSAVASRLTGREGSYVMLKNPELKTYFRVGERDFFLWQMMDGSRTVKDLVVAYFLEYKTFAFSRVAALVLGLKGSGLLVDQPANVYGQVSAQLARRRPQARLMGLWSAFMGKRFAIGGLDRLLSVLYRSGAWLFFTRPALVLYFLVSAVGFYCFFRAFRHGGYGVAQIAGSYTWGVVGLAAAYLIAIFLHESAHAFSVKHYRREVRRAGFMLYMGMPGFFVDTTDIWMEGKRARLAVTWAGPYSGLILGGLASIVMVVWPDLTLNGLFFQFAFMTYILVFFNLNPLLELDGYYLLMDWLEIPGLRRKSLSFLRSGLAAKLKGLARAGNRAKQFITSFSREEKIFAVFGLLSTLWTGYALFAAARYYQSRIAGAVRDLWSQQRGAGQTVFAVVILLLSLVVGAGLVMGLWSMVRGLLHAAARGGLFRGWKLAMTLLVVVLVLTLVPEVLGHPTWLPFVGLAALAVAAVFWAWNAGDLAGSRLAWVFWLLAGLALVLGLKQAMDLAGARAWLGSDIALPAGAALGLLAALLQCGAGLALMSDTDLKQLARWERAILAVGLAASCALLLLLTTWHPDSQDVTDPQTWLAVTGPVAALLLLLALVPALVSYWRTPTAPAWTLLALGETALLVSAVLDLTPMLPSLLLAAGALSFLRAYAALATAQAQPQATFGLLDVKRLDLAAGSVVSSLCREWRALNGERRTRTVEAEFNHYALAAGWRVRLTQGQVEQSLSDELPLAQRGEAYGAALTLLLDLMARQAGEKLTVRALQRAYDGLHWDQREVAAQYLFRHVRRAEALSREFLSTQQSYHALLRRIPLFATMEEGELDLLCSQLRLERFPAGRTVIREGEPGDRFYIIWRGNIEVSQRDANGVNEVVDQHDRGRYIGELALLHDAPRNATCRTTVPTELLSLSRADFERLVKVRFALRDSLDRSLARAELLRGVPLFADLDAHQLQLIAAEMREEEFGAGEVIIRQGEVGETFYVIESGRVQTVVQEDGGERVVAERGPGEFVGEIALLMQVPRTATVRTLTPVRTLVLDRDAFDRLVVKHLYVGRGLEREASRRLIGLRASALSPVAERSGG